MFEAEIRESFINDFLSAMDNMRHNTWNWPIIMATKDYFIGLVEYYDDDFLQEHSQLLETYAFFYGGCVLAKVPSAENTEGFNRAIAPAVKIRTDYNYTITNATVNFYAKGSKPSNKTIEVVNGENGVILRNNTFAYPTLLWYLNYLTYLTHSNQALKINRIRSINKEIYVADKDVNHHHIREFNSLKFGNDWAKVIRTKDGKIPFIALDQPEFKNEQKDLWDDRINILCEYFYMLGTRYNVGEKGDRNTPMEVGLNTARFDILDDNFLSWREKFVKEYNKLFGTKAKVRLKVLKTMENTQELSQMQKEDTKDVVDTNKNL